MKESERWYRAGLRKLPGAAGIEDLFLRYCRALDQRNLTNAFLQTWAVLEDITGNPKNYDAMIKRASYLFTDAWYLRLQLEDMRSIRNQIVHEGAVSARIESLVYTLKRVVEHYLTFALRHPSVITNLADLTEFLSQARDVPLLGRRIERHKLAKEIFSG